MLKGTKYGISAATYPDLDIENLTEDAAKALYKTDWWDALGGEDMNPALVFQVWDMAVNSGIGRAKKTLQKAVGVTADGVIGPATKAAIAELGIFDVLFKFFAQRLRFYTGLTLFAHDGAGWANRVADRLDNAAADV